MSTKGKNEERIPEILKILVLGDNEVEVADFIDKVCSGHFDQPTIDTIGVEFALKAPIDDKSDMYQIWNVLCHPRTKFEAFRPYYLTNSSGGIIVFDVANKDSFQNVEYYVESLLRFNSPYMSLAILGNKKELSKRISGSIGDQEAEEYCARLEEKYAKFYCQIKYFPVSIQNSTNLNDCFRYLSENYWKIKNSLPKILVRGGVNSRYRTFLGKYIKGDENSITGSSNIKIITLGDSKVGIEFILISTSLEHFIEQRIPYYKKANGAIFIYDATSKKPFNDINDFVQEFLRYNKLEKLVFVILGNLTSIKRSKIDSISAQEAENYCLQVQKEANRSGLKIFYYPISFETNLNVESCFQKIAETLTK